jgi:hypothetical protein
LTVRDAEEVTLELSKLNWELLDMTYRFEWDDPEWLAGTKKKSAGDRGEREKILAEWRAKKEKYLSSITRRVKYEALLGRVVAAGHIGKVPYKAVYDMDPEVGLDVNYEIISTKPSGEVRVTEDTKLNLRESAKNW